MKLSMHSLYLITITILTFCQSLAYYQPESPNQWARELAAFKQCQEIGHAIHEQLATLANSGSYVDERGKIPCPVAGYTEEYSLMVAIRAQQVGVYTPWGYWPIGYLSRHTIPEEWADTLQRSLNLAFFADQGSQKLYTLVPDNPVIIYHDLKPRSFPGADKETRWLKMRELAVSGTKP